MKNYFSLIALLLSLNISSQEYKRMIATGTYTVQEIKTEAERYFDITGRERGKGYKPYKRWEYQALRSVDENGTLKSSDFYFNELENYNQSLNQNSENTQRSTVGNWEQLGPTYWNRTSGWNPGVGRITSIAIEQTNTNHIIIGANTGGVWKTTDGGTTWTVLTDNLSNINVASLAIDPTDNTIYFWGSTGGTIFKSTDSGTTWNTIGSTGSGNVNKILIDPTNSTKMYCSVQYNGIFKSTDSGVNWTKINSSSTTGHDIEFKPGDTNTIYATGNKFYKSTDGGTTFTSTADGIDGWSQEQVSGTTNWATSSSNQNNTVTPKTGSSMAFFYIGNFSHPVTKLISPSLNLSGASAPTISFSYSQVDWAGDIDELKVFYKTSSSGTWIELANYTNEAASWVDITLNLPNPSSTYYIAFEGTANYGRGITLDDVLISDATLGTVFQDGFESASNVFNNDAKMIGVSANNPSTVYILEASGSVFGSFYKSTNNGDTFTKLNHTGKNYFGYSSTASDNSGQAPRDMDITVNPNDADEVHIAGVLSWMSTDGGINFNLTSQWTHTNAAAVNVGYCHADIDILEYVDGKLYVGSDGGIFIAENPLTIDTDYYTDLTSGLGIRQFYKIGVNQSDPEIITGGSQDNGTSVYDNTGTWKNWLGADGMESFIDKDNNNILYGTSQFGTLYKSINLGSSYFGIPKPDGKSGSWVTPFEQDPIIQDVIYTGYDQVYKSINGGSSWIAISQVFGSNLNELKITPSNNNIIYTSLGSNLYKTIDGGATDWIQLTGFTGNINSIAIHPTDSNKIAIATTGAQKVYVSTDGGVNWTSYLFDLPNFNASALVWQNNADNGLYLGMNYGVYYIDDTTSNSWQPYSNNLPNVIINELEINVATNKIYAGTYGRGLWKSDLFESSLSVDEFGLNSISMYPNPATKELNLTWNKSDIVSVKIYNSIGKLIYYSKNNNLLNSLKIDISNLSTGLYFVKMNNNNAIITKKLLVK